MSYEMMLYGFVILNDNIFIIIHIYSLINILSDGVELDVFTQPPRATVWTTPPTALRCCLNACKN